MWILYAFLSAIFAGLTAILAKIGMKDTDSNLATALRTVVVLAFSCILVFSTGAIWSLGDMKLSTLLFLVLSGLATGASWICYFRALQLGSINKVVPIDKSSTVLSMLLGIAFLGETDNLPLKICGMLLIAGGTALMLTNGEKKEEAAEAVTDSKGIKNSWWLFAGLSALFAALTSILGKIGVQDVDSNLATTVRTTVVLALAWGIVFWQKKQGEIKSLGKKNWVFLVLSGVATGASWLCYYRALQDGPASVVVPIDKLGIVIAVGFGVLILKEKVSKKAWIGLLLLTLGTLVLLIKI